VQTPLPPVFPSRQYAASLFVRFLTCYNKTLILPGVNAVPELNQHGQTVNDIVPDWKCARALTRTPLVGQYCRLEPLDAERHAADLYEAYALGDDSDWTWLVSTQPVSVEDTAEWVLGKVLDDELVPYAVIDLRTGQAVGLVSYMAIERMQGSVEIGHVTWSRKMKGSRLGTETVWLLLRNAFEHGYRRLEWKCDSMNTASRNAAERLGFVWEGRLRQKLVRKGRNRDSDMLSIIDGEWPQRDAELRAWLAEANFDGEGRQRKKLEAFRL
jgi:RimJ/RimL family protein N-acetyltransferase